jgi:signal transduction histidine kinase
VPTAIIVSVALTAAIVILAAWFCVAEESLLPQTIRPDRLGFTQMNLYAVGITSVLSGMCALVVLCMRWQSALDLWLTVLVFLYTMDIPLSYYPAPTRFSVGWYSIRAIAFLSSSIVLIVLLHEIGTLYARLSRAINAQRREREVRLLTGGTVAAMIAHEVKQPLSAMLTRSETGFRWLDRSVPEIQKAKEQFKEITADGRRTAAVIESIRTNFRMDAARKTSIDANDLIAGALNLARDDLRHHRVIVKAEPNARRPKISGDRIQLQQVLEVSWQETSPIEWPASVLLVALGLAAAASRQACFLRVILPCSHSVLQCGRSLTSGLGRAIVNGTEAVSWRVGRSRALKIVLSTDDFME